jgi:hypothetical protein
LLVSFREDKNNNDGKRLFKCALSFVMLVDSAIHDHLKKSGKLID